MKYPNSSLTNLMKSQKRFEKFGVFLTEKKLRSKKVLCSTNLHTEDIIRLKNYFGKMYLRTKIHFRLKSKPFRKTSPIGLSAMETFSLPY